MRCCVITLYEFRFYSKEPGAHAICASAALKFSSAAVHVWFTCCMCLNCPLPVHVNKYAPRAAPLCGMRKTVSLLYILYKCCAGWRRRRASVYAVCAFLPASRPSQCARPAEAFAFACPGRTMCEFCRTLIHTKENCAALRKKRMLALKRAGNIHLKNVQCRLIFFTRADILQSL